MNNQEIKDFIDYYHNNSNDYYTLAKTYRYFKPAIRDIYCAIEGTSYSKSFKALWECVEWELVLGDGEFDKETLNDFQEAISHIQLQ